MHEDSTVVATLMNAPVPLWSALVRGDALAVWLMDNDIDGELIAGARFVFRDRPRPCWDGVCSCEVLEAAPPAECVRGEGRAGDPLRR